MRVLAATVGIGAVASCLGVADASADPLRPDPAQPPDGIGVVGPVITPPASPVQVPRPVIASDGGRTSVSAHPYLSRWVHDRIVTPPGTAIEVRGAVRADLSGVGGPVLDLFGHCLFEDGRATSTERSASLAPIRLKADPLSVVIEPTVHRR